MRRLLWFVAALAVACARQGDDSSVLQADDLRQTEIPFDQDDVLDAGSLTDSLALPTAREVQAFLSKTPYGRASFLATYQSNGVRAADAIARAADKYQINPLVLLVRAQVDQGLVGTQYYPSPPSRVEYVFGCGCPGGTAKCDPAYAGFDRQVDCLGAALRALTDEALGAGVTASGWGAGRTQRTTDGVLVTPRDAGTAVLYAYTPYVAMNKPGGVWVFWNVWQNYAAFVGYAGALGPPVGTKRWIGDACTSDPLCAAIPDGVCVQNFPSGMCTTACSKSQPCPNDMDHPQTFCANFGANGGFCLPVCNPSNPASCRPGYECKLANELGTQTNRNGCLPK
jgi:hypothetical protein